MRLIAAVLTVGLVAGCISYSAGPTGVPVTPSPTPGESLVPVVTAPPLPTAAPGSSPTFDVLGLLAASVTVFNLSDSDLSVTAVLQDPSEGGEDIPVGDFVVGSGQSTTRSVIAAADEVVPYMIDFGYPEGSNAVGGSCTLSVRLGDNYTFVAVNEGLTVNRAGESAVTEDELLIGTSTLCQPAAEARR